MIEEIDRAQMERLLKQGALLVDVREEDEIANDGSIAGTTVMPLSRFEDFKEQLPTDRPVVFYCRSGRRSLKAAAIAETWTKQPLYSLAGGWLGYKGE